MRLIQLQDLLTIGVIREALEIEIGEKYVEQTI